MSRVIIIIHIRKDRYAIQKPHLHPKQQSNCPPSDIYKDYFTDTEYAVFKVDSRTEIATLRTFEANLKSNITPKSNLTSSEKVALYRSYFRLFNV